MLVVHTRLALPEWAQVEVDDARAYPDDEAKIALAIRLSASNIHHRSGGPFGAAIFDEADGRLLAVGVNRVLPEQCSVAHAEMMAFMSAQARTGHPRLNEDGMRVVLASSAQPCCMCYGACFWTGIDTLLIGARSEDVMALTAFDEGPLPVDWIGELQQRGIAVRRDIQRDAACAVLREYGKLGETQY